MNIRQEILEFTTKYNLTIEFISLKLTNWQYNQGVLILDKLCGRYTQELIKRLDSKYNKKEVFGTIYCRDTEGFPVWITRELYKDKYVWEIHTIPDYYKIKH